VGGCVQATFWCTTSRAKKVSVSLTLVGLTATAVDWVCRRFCVREFSSDFDRTISTVSEALVPVAVLVINVVVAVQVRRAASNAAANLGVQPHHQQTSIYNNSAVPTVMLIATSIIYVLIYSTEGILIAATELLRYNNYVLGLRLVLLKSSSVTHYLQKFVFAYNFYVYLITGKQFRAELRKLLSRCLPSSFASAPATSVTGRPTAAIPMVAAAGQ